jgi:hypothetical protein
MLPTSAMVSNGDARPLPGWLQIAAIAGLADDRHAAWRKLVI